TLVAGTISAAVANNGSVTMQELSLEMPLREARDAFERIYFEHHLTREQGSMTRVAERTGLERTHLYRKLKQLGIDLARGAYRKANNHKASRERASSCASGNGAPAGPVEPAG